MAASERLNDASLPGFSPIRRAGLDAGARRPRASGGLHAIDACARDPEARGVVYVESLPALRAALARHIGRRARAAGRTLVIAGAGGAVDPWREVAARFGAGACTDPRDAAAVVRARAGCSLLLLIEDPPTGWGRALARELETAGQEGGSPEPRGHEDRSPVAEESFLAVILTDRAPAGTDARVIELGPGLSPAEARLWCEAVAADGDDPMTPSLESLDALDAWWTVARATPSFARPTAPLLSLPERRLLDRLALAQRSFSAREIAELDVGQDAGHRHAGVAPGLIERRLLVVDDLGSISLGIAAPISSAGDDEDARVVARVLEAIAPPDPWALLRAAELHARRGAHEEAEDAATRALRAVKDVTARGDLWARYEQVLAGQPEEEATARRIRAAELALRLGDVDCALGFAHAAAARQEDTYASMWMLGCATAARGDLTMAGIALGKALALAPAGAPRAAASAQLADVRYLAGDFAGARLSADEALAEAGDVATRLAARNVLGKLHFVTAAWSEAEQHFAADAYEAARAGDLSSELRARLNRAIALLQWGRRDQARATLLAVLQDGRRAGEVKPVARALHNLAVEAHLRHDYAEALRWYEEALDAARRQGEQVPLAHVIRSMAELKVDLGLVAEAEQTLAFGRRACGPGMPGVLIVHFELLAARIHLAEGRTADAAAAVSLALAHVGSSDTGQMSAQCHLLAARVALEDGDLARMASALLLATADAPSGRAGAEAALLEAQRARAAGLPFAGAALSALELARNVERTDLVLEAHILLAGSHDDTARARTHLAAAGALRDRLVGALPPEIRPRLLARRDLATLARLEAGASVLGETSPFAVAPAHAETAKPPAQRPVLRPVPAAALDAASRIVGVDPAIVALRASIPRVASVDATLLIRGQSGTGKELVAEAVHAASRRRNGPLVKVNCAALVETLLLSELFGHEKGAFTGATARRQGRFELAEGGTIFLDEIGDISPRTQTALLRVLQERTFERVGGTTTLRSDCRVLCATHRDLKALAAQGAFREDLYFRLEGLVVDVPALRRRLGDLPLLAEAILQRIAAESGQPLKRLSPRALAALGRHGWPGNVRELENALRAASLFAEGAELEAEDFTRHVDGLRELPVTMGDPRRVPQTPPIEPVEAARDRAEPTTLRARDVEPAVQEGVPAPRPSGTTTLEAPVGAAYACVRAGLPLRDMNRRIERECIAMALSESGGNITRAAEILGMGRSRVSQLVTQYGFRSTDASAEETAV
jgi:DNA-binding NtrC family response regulator/tetratricopeptide (TPR) repeat protein